MASFFISSHYLLFSVLVSLLSLKISAHNSDCLSPHFYRKSCPKALPTIKKVVRDAVNRESRTAASLLRLHFHDCFVNGCDGSLLLDSTPSFQSEKFSFPNNNSIRRLEVIDRIKTAVDKVCGRPVVSCADILAVAARDSVVALGGPTWKVPLGRRDSRTASIQASGANLPLANFSISALLSNFQRQGLNARDLVTLSAGHVIGFSRCVAFRNRIYNETTIDPAFANERRATCPRTVGQGDDNLAPLDPTPAIFDNLYFTNLLRQRGLLHSDHELLNDGTTARLVNLYATNTKAFFRDFAKSMIKMGNISPLTGNQGEIRVNCRRVN